MAVGSQERLDMGCPEARVLVDVHDRRARIAVGLHGSRLEMVVREQRAAEYAAHIAHCPRCQANLRACPHCRRDAWKAGHSFWCRNNAHRWRGLWARLFPARAQGAPKKDGRAAVRVQVKAEPEDVLGIAPTATLAQAREAYHALAKRYHPDLWIKAPRRKREDVGRRMREINEAYEAFCRRKADEG